MPGVFALRERLAPKRGRAAKTFMVTTKGMFMKNLWVASGLAFFALAGSAQAAEPPAKFNMYCIACHGTGAAGAPKAGDTAAWAPRIGVGADALVASAKAGKNAMPPKGLCSDCTDAELKEIIQFMSGAK